MASRKRDDAMAGLLKRNLAHDAGAGDDCPAPDILAAYFERSLDADETAHVERHLSECARCREQFAALGRAEEGAAAPAVQAPRHQPRVFWLWDWRWLAPVAAVLVIAAVWATRRPELTRIAEHPEQTPAAVATSLSAQQPPQPTAQQTKPQTKQEALSQLAAPAPNGVPAARKTAPAANSGTTNSGVGVPAAILENSPTRTLVAPKSVESLPLAGRNYTELKKLPETTPPAKSDSTDQVSNASVPHATTESVTVESETPAVAGAAAAPSPASTAPAPPQSSGGAVGGVVSGAVNARTQSSNAKEAPALVSTFRARAEIVTANQAGEVSPAHIITTPDSKILWRIASGGFIERSEDGGATWNGTLPSPNAHFVAGSAPSAKVCWLAGDDGIILVTEDASNWRVISPPLREDFVAISARNASSATVTTADGRKFTTTNQGESWTPAK
ncbi:MAG: zf-HC2 domain-containing protein [Candidatus Acidiferrales bacterium]